MSRLYFLCPSPRSVGTSPRPRNCIASIAPGGGRWNEHSLCHPWTNDSVRSRSNETPWNATGQHHNSWLLPMRGSHQLHTPHSASEPFTQAALCADLCAAAEDPRSDIGIVLRCRKPRVFNMPKMIFSCKTDHQISGFSDVFRQTPVFLHYITTLEV